MKIQLVFLICFAWLLAGCGIDPRDQAEAEAIRLKAEQDALDQAEQREQETGIYLLNQAEREQTREARVKAARMVATVAGYAGAVGVAVAILGAGVGLGLAAVETGRAAGRAAEVKANLIPLAETTRQYPLFVQNQGRGLFTAYNPNTGAVIPLHIARREDRQLITASGAVQIAGMIAREARLSDDAAGIAIINPPLVTVESEER